MRQKSKSLVSLYIMKLKDIKISHIIILVLAFIIAFGVYFYGGKDRYIINEAEDSTETALENRSELRQGVKDSLELVRVLQDSIHTLQNELEALREEKQIVTVIEYEETLSDIDDNSVLDDISVYSNYLSSRESDFGGGHADTNNTSTVEIDK